MEITDWNKKYEPKELDEMILNPAVRVKLENIFRTPQNVTLYGAPGVGKGTYTNIFIKKNGCYDLRINASKETGIDTIREKVSSFANAANPTAFFDIEGADGEIIDGFRVMHPVGTQWREHKGKLERFFLKFRCRSSLLQFILCILCRQGTISQEENKRAQ